MRSKSPDYEPCNNKKSGGQVVAHRAEMLRKVNNKRASFDLSLLNSSVTNMLQKSVFYV